MKSKVTTSENILCPRDSVRFFGSFTFVLNSVYVRYSVIMCLIEQNIIRFINFDL